ncbi:hypothetical protein J5N97_021039 [Dioscorea zingiberensis]|uniref:Uncharacterized protein n=1 Tax=Dioscorea zingiberensis TaxID=325984 RepID=A0A9D5HE77_9LILI|nr:hypothetical protein J5N97_021039 [Dioscorea zingiberensis]
MSGGSDLALAAAQIRCSSAPPSVLQLRNMCALLQRPTLLATGHTLHLSLAEFLLSLFSVDALPGCILALSCGCPIWLHLISLPFLGGNRRALYPFSDGLRPTKPSAPLCATAPLRLLPLLNCFFFWCAQKPTISPSHSSSPAIPHSLADDALPLAPRRAPRSTVSVYITVCITVSVLHHITVLVCICSLAAAP